MPQHIIITENSDTVCISKTKKYVTLIIVQMVQIALSVMDFCLIVNPSKQVSKLKTDWSFTIEVKAQARHHKFLC